MYNFAVGDVVKVFYFNVLHRYRKIFTFTGVCINYSLLHRSFTLQNFYGSEFLRIHFTLGAPYIVAIDVLKTYFLKNRQARMHYYKKMSFVAKANDLSYKAVTGYKDPIDFLYRIPLAKTERKRLRRKFRI
jgi:ribosomal protein L19